MFSYQTKTEKKRSTQAIQPKLKIGQPGDKYEQEADAVADRVMRMSESDTMQMQPMEEEEEELMPKLRMQPNEEEEELMQPKIQMHPKSSEGGGFASQEITQQINSTKGNGTRLSPDTNMLMSNAFNKDFGNVKVHTDATSSQLNQQLGAEAFTHGKDIYFKSGNYDTNSSKGKHLLAHELTHVVQQDNANDMPIQRWVSLGYEYWKVSGWSPRKMKVWTGTKDEWKSDIQDMDDESDYEDGLWGILSVSNDPSIVNRTRAPSHIGNVPYENTIERAPNQSEKLELLRALYEVGGSLDLWHGSMWEGGPWIRSADIQLAKFIQENQGLIISEVSNAGEVIDSQSVKALSEQGGKMATMAMIMNAGATANKGVDLIMTANRMQGQQRESAHADAMETIRNSGRVIREALKGHDARIAFQQAVIGQVFDTVWGMIPGGGTLASAAMGILKTGLSNMLLNAQNESGPEEQAETINNEFVASCNRLVDLGHILSSDAQDAINGFEAVRR